MADCIECKCPTHWHSYVTGHCYGCGKICKTEIRPEQLPFEIAQDRKKTAEEFLALRGGRNFNKNQTEICKDCLFYYPKAQFGESKSTCELEAKPLNNNCTRKIIPPG